MGLPNIPDRDRAKPISYDPARGKFILYADAVERREKLLSPYDLPRQELKRLIIERHRRGPDYTVRTSTGETYSRDEVIDAIEKETEFGKATVDAEAVYVAALVKQISDALSEQ